MSRYTNILIRASAGTGKTFQLSNRYLSLMNSGAPADRILATTFTRKAAGEILDRIVIRLAAAALDDDRCAELAEQLQSPSLTRSRCRELLLQLMQNLHRLRISTLDSFFAQIASSFSLELGLPPGWQIVDELRDAQLRTEAIEAILHDSTRDVARLMNLLTKGEAERSISDLVRSTVNGLYGLYLETPPEAWHKFPHVVLSAEKRGLAPELLCDHDGQTTDRVPVPFFQLAADELAQKRGLTPSASNLRASEDSRSRVPVPFFQLAADELTATIERLRTIALPPDSRFEKSRTRDYEFAAQHDWECFIAGGLAARIVKGEFTYYRKQIPQPAIEVYEKLLGHAKGLIIEQLASQTAATHQLLQHFDEVYRRLKFAARAMRFEDITRHLSGVATLADVQRLEFRLDSQVAHLLLDEFQDTSLAQWQVVRPFAERITRTGGQQMFFWSGGQQSFFCVGDVKQAIYGWRGGKSEIFDALEVHLDELAHESLTRSFRSAQPVIDTVNQIFTNLPAHTNLANMTAATQQWCGKFQSHQTAKRDLSGYTCLITAPRASDGQKQQSVTLHFAAEQIAEIVRQAPGHSVGVLARRNSVVAQLIFELRRLGVAASEEGGNPLTDSVAVQVVMSLLRLADHPGDTVARFHLAHSPLGALLGLTDHRNDHQAQRLAGQIRRSLLDQGYGPAIYQWTRLMAPSCNRRDLSRLEQLVELAYGFQSTSTLRTTDFLLYIQQQRVSDPTTADVRVMTIHQAKGLQFDVVVLPDLDAKLIGQNKACVVSQPDPTKPVDRVCLYRNSSIQALLPRDLQQLFEEATNQAVSEALCVLYVAVTRAVHALHMVIAPSTAKGSGMIPKTAGGLLRAALTDGSRAEPSSILYEHGDRCWFDCPGTPPKRAAAAIQPEAKPIAIDVAPMPGGRTSGLRRATPSGLEGGEIVHLENVLRLDNAASMARGTLIHAWFEQIRWLDDGRPDPATLRHIAEKIELGGLHIDDALSSFHAMLQSPATAAALSRRSYPTPNGTPLDLRVHNERRFAVQHSGRLLSGTIDRLVLIYQNNKLVGADVIDFKTDAVSSDDPAGLEATVEHYRPQLEAYRHAVATMYQLPPTKITTRLLLLGPDIVKTVSSNTTQTNS